MSTSDPPSKSATLRVSWQTISAMAAIAVTVVGAITWGARLQTGLERAQVDIAALDGALEKHEQTDAHPTAARRLDLMEQRQQTSNGDNAATRAAVVKMTEQVNLMTRQMDALCIASRAPGCRLSDRP